MATINIPSENIQLYPSAYRGVGANHALFNPEARIPSELNITNQTNNFGRSSFIISPQTTGVLQANDIIIFVIHGYWFKLKLTNEMLSSSLYAQIQLENKNNNPSAYQYAGTVLKSYHKTNDTADVNLDYGTSPNFYFSGLQLQDTPFTDVNNQYSLQLLTSEHKIPKSSFLRIDSKYIANIVNDADISIAEKFITDYISSTDIEVTDTANIATANITTNNSDILNTLRIDGKTYSSNTATVILGKAENVKQTLNFVPMPKTSTTQNPAINFGSISQKINELNIITINSDEINVGKLTATNSTDSINAPSINATSSISAPTITSTTLINAKDITATGTISAATVAVSGTINALSVSAQTFTATSDIRLKENIKEFRCKKSILDLPIKEFDFKDTGKHTIGCIAQELQEICPEIVHKNEDGYLSIEENKLIYLLIQEVKQLKEDIEKLK